VSESVTTRESATVFPIFKEIRDEKTGQVAKYAILVEGAQVGTVAKSAVAKPKKGEAKVRWTVRIKGQRGTIVAATRSQAVMAAIAGSFVAN